MEELLGVLASGLLEVAVEALGSLLCSELVKVLYRLFVRFIGKRIASAVGMAALLLATGAVIGGFSVWLIPHPIVPPSRLHGVSVVLSPLLVGAAAWLIGRLYTDAEHPGTPRQDFWSGAAFAFAMALMRFVLVSY